MRTQTQTVVTCGLVVLIEAAVSLASPARAESRGPCTTAVVEEPFETPDGSRHQPGRVTLCENRVFSPVASPRLKYETAAQEKSRQGIAPTA